MSESKRSFWASIPGLVTGLAGLLTGVLGLGTLAVQQGIIGDGDGDDSPATTVTAPPAGAGATTTTAGTPSFTVDPTMVKLGPAEREKSVKVQNTSTTAAITVRAPVLTGPEASAFKTAGCANERLDPGRSCTVTLTYTQGGPLKAATATLVVKADGVARSTEVPIETSRL